MSCQGYIFYLLLQICLGEKKKMKNKNREGKKLKTHALLTRNSFFILFPYFDISLYPIFWIFFLVPVYIFFFSLFLCCPRDFRHGFYFVGILSVFFTLFLYFFLSLLVFFFPLFVLPEGFSPLFQVVGFLWDFFTILLYLFLTLLRFFLSLIYFCSVGRILDTVFNLSFFGVSLPYFGIYFLSLFTFLYFSNPSSS